jgi:hypothetical protein
MPKHRWTCGCVSEIVNYGECEIDDVVESCTVRYINVCPQHHKHALSDFNVVEIKGVPQDYGAVLV